MNGEPRLAGRRVVTTRDQPGRLDSLLAAHGADVVHVPLIEIVEPPDGGTAMYDALSRLHTFDWLVVTSRHGAQRVGRAAAEHRHLRLAAVGRATADRLAALAGRPVDVVPDRQTAADLTAALAERSGRVLVAQADRADGALAVGLRASGLTAEVVTAYSTRLRRPTRAQRIAMDAADAVTFASGSSVEAWVEAVGVVAPRVVVAIGPSTAAVGHRLGLKPTHVAADHDIEGLAAAVVDALGAERAPQG